MKKEVALYIRLSMEDHDVGEEKDESCSVQNQREYLYYFLKENPQIETGPVREYVDDGYSGTNFDRPGIQELLQRVWEGQVQTIIVKDLSRLGRNYIEVGKCLEEIFPLNGVRFIAVNDAYDSSKAELPGMDVVFKNIIHDYYSKELSGKVLQAKTSLAYQGLFLGGIPPFGYIRNPENKYQLLVEAKSAQMVKEIYRLRMKGKSYNEIARYLNEKRAETPAERLERLGLRKKGSEQKVNEWSAFSVREILKNPVVTGTVINHRVQRKEIGRAQLSRVKRDEQIHIAGMHEAIISREMFEHVQQMCITQKKIPAGGGKKKRIYPLTGLVKCGYCGKNLVVEGKEKKRYICPQGRASIDAGHKEICLEEGFVLESILSVLSVGMRLEEEKKNFSEKKERRPEKEAEQQKLRALYERYTRGEITRQDFAEQKKDIYKKKHLSVEKEAAEAVKKENRSYTAEQAEAAWRDRDYQYLKQLLRERVEKIIGYQDQQIDVIWKKMSNYAIK